MNGKNLKNPCSICEKHMKGVRCDEADACPVGQMKKENASLKRRLKKYENDASWDFEDRSLAAVKKNMSVDDGGFSDD